jgi:hypothetical protein
MDVFEDCLSDIQRCSRPPFARSIKQGQDKEKKDCCNEPERTHKSQASIDKREGSGR